MMFLLVLAVIGFVPGSLAVKLLWWAALLCATVWVAGMLRGRQPIFR